MYAFTDVKIILTELKDISYSTNHHLMYKEIAQEITKMTGIYGGRMLKLPTLQEEDAH